MIHPVVAGPRGRGVGRSVSGWDSAGGVGENITDNQVEHNVSGGPGQAYNIIYISTEISTLTNGMSE